MVLTVLTADTLSGAVMSTTRTTELIAMMDAPIPSEDIILSCNVLFEDPMQYEMKVFNTFFRDMAEMVENPPETKIAILMMTLIVSLLNDLSNNVLVPMKSKQKKTTKDNIAHDLAMILETIWDRVPTLENDEPARLVHTVLKLPRQFWSEVCENQKDMEKLFKTTSLKGSTKTDYELLQTFLPCGDNSLGALGNYTLRAGQHLYDFKDKNHMLASAVTRAGVIPDTLLTQVKEQGLLEKEYLDNKFYGFLLNGVGGLIWSSLFDVAEMFLPEDVELYDYLAEVVMEKVDEHVNIKN